MSRIVSATSRSNEIGIVQTLWLHNQLAQAARADFRAHDDPHDALMLGAARMSAEQARVFLASWRMVAQYPADVIPGIHDASAFALTLFQNLDTTEYIFALRGVPYAYEELAEAVGEVLADRLSLQQIISVYNYWQRLNATPGSHYAIVAEVELDDESAALRAAYRESPASGLRAELSLRARAEIEIDQITHTVYAIRQVASPDPDGLGVLRFLSATPASEPKATRAARSAVSV